VRGDDIELGDGFRRPERANSIAEARRYSPKNNNNTNTNTSNTDNNTTKNTTTNTVFTPYQNPNYEAKEGSQGSE
jgi:hypothetical protein